MLASKLSLVVALLALVLLGSVQGIILPRHKAPAFTNVHAVADQAFTRLSLSDYAGKYLILLFYPFDFTYVRRFWLAFCQSLC